MHGGRLSAAEKGKQKAADDADLPHALGLVLESAGELRRPAGDAAAANWHAGGAGVPLPRHLLLVPPSGTSEIEEAPPSRPDLPGLNTEDAAVAAGLAAVAGLEGRVMELQAALDSRLRELEEANKRQREGVGEPEPEVAGGAAEVQVLQHQLGMVQKRVSGMKDTMLVLRFQTEEMHALFA